MNHDSRRPTRKQVLEHMKVAGYNADLKTFMRLKLSNRISAERCQAAWDQGVTTKYFEVKARKEREPEITS